MNSSEAQGSFERARDATSRGRVLKFAGLAFLVLVYAVLSTGIYYGLTERAPGANDFYSRWMGARALLLRGQNPYDEQVTREIQIGMYGRPARADEDEVAFAYPLYAAYLAAPFITLSYPVAQALWMALLVMGVEAGAFALAWVNRTVWSPAVVGGLALGALLFYPSVRGIFLGQYALVSFALVALAGLAIATEHETTAGILLALASAKPQPVVLLLPVILFWAWCNGKRRVVWSALFTLGALAGSSFALVPSWFGDFLTGLGNYAQYAPVGPPLDTLFRLAMPNAPVMAPVIGVSVLLVVGMGVLVWRGRNQEWHEFQPTLGVVGLVTTLIAGRIGTPDQILLLIPWLAWFALWGAQKKRGYVVVGAVAWLALPWALFLILLEGNHEAIAVTTILPVMTGAVLLGNLIAPLRHGRAV